MCKGTYWNYRVLKTVYTHNCEAMEGEIENTYQIIEVYYDEKDKPLFYSDDSKVFWCDDEDPREIFDRMQLAFDRPVLTKEDFPEETENNYD